VAVEVGSKPEVEGVMRAFRFCVMLSSIAPRDIRRKSEKLLAYNLLADETSCLLKRCC